MNKSCMFTLKIKEKFHTFDDIEVSSILLVISMSCFRAISSKFIKIYPWTWQNWRSDSILSIFEKVIVKNIYTHQSRIISWWKYSRTFIDLLLSVSINNSNFDWNIDILTGGVRIPLCWNFLLRWNLVCILFICSWQIKTF